MATVTSFLLLFATFILLVASIKEVVAGDVVLDIDGDPLTAGGRYYAASAISGAGGGGGLSFRNRGDRTYTVKQESSYLKRGIPLIFSPRLAKEGLITESKSLTISFDIVGINSVWQLTHTNDGNFVTIKGHPVATNSGNSLFQIKSVPLGMGGPVYKLIHCIVPTICSDIGISDPGRWLELSEKPELSQRPLLLVFIKANTMTLEELK